MNKVYIVIVNYNNYLDTIECLESILKSCYTNFQVVVVDNSSDNWSIKQLSEWAHNDSYKDINTSFNTLVFPLSHKPLDCETVVEPLVNNGSELLTRKLTFIRSENKGFAAANNIVLSYILKKGEQSSLIWLLNNDTVIEKNTLSNLVAFHENKSNDKCILGAKLRNYDKPDVIQAVAGRYDKVLGSHSHIGEGEKDTGQYDNYVPRKMDYIVGASMFFSFFFVEQTGLMCEDYFLYFEELDWLNVGRKHGYTIKLVPNAIVYHKEGASIAGHDKRNKGSLTAEYYSITSRVKFIKKWYPWRLITVMPGVIWALSKKIVQGKFGLVKKSSIAIFKILFTDNFPYFVYNR
jgi:GT2 family glycosyltransferase